MQPQLYAWQLLSIIVASILNEQQKRVIDYLKKEYQIRREQLGSKRIPYSPNIRLPSQESYFWATILFWRPELSKFQTMNLRSSHMLKRLFRIKKLTKWFPSS